MDIEFILQAESPMLFAAFCLNLKNFDRDKNYAIKTPIFLDATCSGIQHFAGMLLDEDLAESVNLKYTNDEVQDVYSKLIKPINEKIHYYGMKYMIGEFADLSITRQLLKFIVMTKCYNVSVYGIYTRLRNKLEHIKVHKPPKTNDAITKGLYSEDYKFLQDSIVETIKRKKENVVRARTPDQITMYKFPALNNSGFTLLNDSMLYKLSSVISDNVFSYFPSINKVYHFLTKWVALMIKLNLPIKWITPLGLEVVQSYNKSSRSNITINFLGKRRKIIIRE